MLSETLWVILYLLKPVMELFMTAQKLLEGEKYLAIILLVTG